MAKIIAWLILIFIVLLALRMINVRNAASAAARGSSAAPSADAAADGSLRPLRRVPAARRSDVPSSGGYACADGQCAKR